MGTSARNAVVCAIVVALSAPLLRAAEKATTVVIVADSRHLTGLRGWWANLYNDSHLYFAIVTVLMIPLAGIILGTVADRLMALIGIDLKSRTLRES